MEVATLRDTIANAIDEVEPQESEFRSQDEDADHPSSKGTEPGTAPAAPAAPVGDPAAAPAEQPPAAPEKAPAAPAEVKPGEPAKPAAPAELKAPSQWKPQVREQWAKLPREVQEEILRREGDNLRLVGSVGQKIKFADDVGQHLAPFAQRLQANNVPPQAFVADIFTTVKGLANGSPQEKAELIANIVQSYGIDVQMLDQVLTARIHAPAPNPEVIAARQLAARAQAILVQQQTGVATQVEQSATTALTAFGNDPKHEFFPDVRDLMADLMEAGRANTLDEAYSAAIWAHPDTRKILLQREAQTRATQRQQRANVARDASSSVYGSPRAPTAAINPNGSLRETIEAVVDDLSQS